MDTFDLGIQYEVALEVLGQRLQPMIMAIEKEKAKENPSAQFINYCEMRIDALEELQDALTPDNKDIILQILNSEAEFQIV